MNRYSKNVIGAEFCLMATFFFGTIANASSYQPAAAPDVRLVFAVLPGAPTKMENETCVFSMKAGNYEQYEPGFCVIENLSTGANSYVAFNLGDAERASRDGYTFILDAPYEWANATPVSNTGSLLIDYAIRVGGELEKIVNENPSDLAKKPSDSVFRKWVQLLIPTAEAQPSFVRGVAHAGKALLDLLKRKAPSLLAEADELVAASHLRWRGRFSTTVVRLNPDHSRFLKDAIQTSGQALIHMEGSGTFATLSQLGNGSMILRIGPKIGR